jgi:hypothetical protein
MRKLLIIILFSFMCAACSEPHLDIFPPLEEAELTSQKISPDLLKEDVDAFYLGAKELHPALFSYADKAQLEAKVNEIKAKLTEPMTRLEFYKLVGQLSHAFGDGHSMLLWPYQEYQAMREENGPFPFSVHVDNNQQLLMKTAYQNKSGDTIAAGSRIVAINNVPSNELISTMEQYVGGETKRLRQQFTASRFQFYLWSIYGVAGNFSLDLQVNGKHVTIDVADDQNWELADKTQKQADFYFEDLGNYTAYLHIGHFDIDPDWFEGFIDDAFENFKEKGIKSLIIDVRPNTGGNTDTALYLLRYIADKPFRPASNVMEKLNEHNRGIFDYKGNTGEIIDDDWDDWISPFDERERFNGEVYVLMSPITYSAGIVFTSTIKDFNFATIVGQETGGNANQTGQGNLFNLPHSQLRAYIATRLIVRPSGIVEPGGVKPDHIVFPTQETLAEGRDVELEYAVQLINDK